MPLSPWPFPAVGLIPTSSPATSPSRPSLSHWVLAASSLPGVPGRRAGWVTGHCIKEEKPGSGKLALTCGHPAGDRAVSPT